jgi:hypothetical protein
MSIVCNDFQCLTRLVNALGLACEPYAEDIFRHCNKMIHRPLILEEADALFLASTLELLSALTEQSLNDVMEKLVTESNPDFLTILVDCLRVHDEDVKGAAYRLLGDLASSGSTFLQPRMQSFIQEAISQLTSNTEVDYIPDSNNATWSVGLLAMNCGRGANCDCSPYQM